ncbi:Retrovirus-related Pol polyprotein from transposon RE1 [Vitis vinifera]|uniref:Retrovirus-related Pol polyprotein from transposon RE1 n=1 Tax=Vitis vinifera TaxID=29760 RepID=A0A438GAU4_VITVI|nr:Retrovirus-related Pol polyprotein from transposon RE1 [Vitis vinifera]
MPSFVLHDQIPHSLLFPDQPLYFLPPRVFGCTCFVHILTLGQDKLSAKAMKCLFLGYSRLQRVIVVIPLRLIDTLSPLMSPSLRTHHSFLPLLSLFLFLKSCPFPLSPHLMLCSSTTSGLSSSPRVVALLPFAEAPADSLLSLRLHLPRLCLLLMTYPLLFGKVGPDGQVDRLKARLVAKGYTQVYGSDYGDTFSPVAKIASVRLLLSMAAMCSWPLYQLDIKNAFLHGDLVEEVYMEQPPGFVAQGESGLVCRLRRSLYGLKQSPRAWFGRFSSVVQEFGMLRSTADHSVFYHHNSLGQCIYLVVYVDDIVITGSDQDDSSIQFWCGPFQRKYALDILEETGMLDCKPVDTPMDPNVKLCTRTGGAFRRPWRYRRLVGKLNYLTITRPDISFPIDVPLQRYCVFIGGNLISWKSKKQDVVADLALKPSIELWLWQHVNSYG